MAKLQKHKWTRVPVLIVLIAYNLFKVPVLPQDAQIDMISTFPGGKGRDQS